MNSLINQKYLTEDGCNLKDVRFVIEYAGLKNSDGECYYRGSVLFKIVAGDGSISPFVVAANSNCESELEAFNFCQIAKSNIIDFILNNNVTSVVQIHDEMEHRNLI